MITSDSYLLLEINYISKYVIESIDWSVRRGNPIKSYL